MQVSDFDFELPSELIANYPSTQRSGCRLLSLDGKTGKLSHGIFSDILDQITANDLLIFNDTRVIPARLFGSKESGGKIELLVERILTPSQALVHLKSSRSPKVGSRLRFNDSNVQATVIGRDGALFLLEFDSAVLALLDEVGHIPLPPYIERPDEAIDRELYQTVYGNKLGAVAAPTAGLHFDEELLAALRDKGVAMQYVTLHVGAGTFLPVKGDDLATHIMHREYVEVSEVVVQAITACKMRGGRVIAVGTTSVRSLESAAQQMDEQQELQAFSGDTQIFIYPGYHYRVVDALITNFHLPKSTLIMLVSAFAGYRNTFNAYHTAIEQQYRFFSYGDAMFITHNPAAEQELIG